MLPRRGGLAGALLVTTAFMMLAIYRSDLEGIAFRVIAGWSLWLGFSLWRLKHEDECESLKPRRFNE
jgi:hypothetical protein